jgi:histidinol-phosphate aminotransferase
MKFPLNLDKNENQYGPSPKCYRVLKKVTMEMFNSYSRDYPKRLKEKISEKFKVKTDRIIIGYGSEDILKQVIHYAIKSKDDVLALPDKSWWYYKAIGKEVGANIIEYNLVEKEDSFAYDDEQILDILKNKKPRAIIICTPNNPTGNFLSEDRLEKFVQAADKNTLIIIDEAYWGFSQFLYGEDLVEKYDNVIVIRTFSKFYSLAGIRIGYGFVGKNLSDLQIYNNRYLGYNRISEELTFAALDSDKYYIKKSDQIMQDSKMYFRELKEMGFKPFETHANFIFAKLPDKEFNLLEKELPKRQIIIKFFKEAVFPNYIRISIGTKAQNNYVVKCMKEILAQSNS